MQWIGFVGATAVAVTLLASGLLKLTAWEASAASLQGLNLMPRPLADLVGRAIPILEIILSVAYLLGLAHRVSLLLMATMFTAFFAAGVKGLRAGTEVECYCFGPLLKGRWGAGSAAHAAYLGVLSLAGWVWSGPTVPEIVTTSDTLQLLLTCLQVTCLVQVGLMARLVGYR